MNRTIRIKALRGSVKKWEAICNGTGADYGVRDCPLCEKFLSTGTGSCVNCPVVEDTKQLLCSGSPYDFWCYAIAKRDSSIGKWLPGCKATDDETVMLAVLEREYLKDLLAKELRLQRSGK